MGAIAVYLGVALICLMALNRPYIGVLGYFGCATLVPTYAWRWSLSQDANFQKYIAAATCLGVLITLPRGNRVRGPAALSCWGLIAFLGLAFLSCFGSIEPSDSWWLMGYLWKIVLMALLGVYLIDTPRKLWALLWTLALCQGYNAYQINLQYFQDGYSYAARRGWSYLDNNTYSIFTVPVFSVSVGLAIYSRVLWQSALAAAIAGLQVHQIMMMESRGVMIGALVSLGVVAFLMPWNTRTISMAVAGTLLGGVLAGPPVVKEFRSSFASEEERDSSADSRFKLWQAGAGITADHPLRGVGINAGRRLVSAYYPGGLGAKDKSLHNLLFEISTGAGVPALVAFLTFLAAPVLGMLPIRTGDLPPPLRACRLAVCGGMVGFLVSAMFSSSLLIETPYIVAAAGAAGLTLIRAHRVLPFE